MRMLGADQPHPRAVRLTSIAALPYRGPRAGRLGTRQRRKHECGPHDTEERRAGAASRWCGGAARPSHPPPAARTPATPTPPRPLAPAARPAAALQVRGRAPAARSPCAPERAARTLQRRARCSASFPASPQSVYLQMQHKFKVSIL
jgi:hypothetical protein